MTAPVGAQASFTPQTPPRNAADLCAAANLGLAARALLDGNGPPPKDFIARLVTANLHAEAVRFLAHALPRRECVWWAWVCARKAAGTQPPPEIKNALDVTERWIVQPTEEHRRDALVAGEAADFGTPAGCAALAAFMSSGSLAPTHAPAVAPGEFMTAKAASGGVTLAAVSDPDRAVERFTEFLGLGLDVAERTRLWGT